MPSRTAYEAVINHEENVQLLVSCVTRSVVKVAGGYFQGASRPHRLELNNGRPAALGGESRLMLKLQQHFHIDNTDGRGSAWAVRIVGYHYAVYDDRHREILVYHWHPQGTSPIVTPHLHLEHGAQVGRHDIRDAHLPTGYVTVADIIGLLIRDLSALPNREDWDFILSENPDTVPTT